MAEVIELPKCDICKKVIDRDSVDTTKQMANGTTAPAQLHRVCLMGFKNNQLQQQVVALGQQLAAANSMVCALLHRFGGTVTFKPEDIKTAMEVTEGNFEVQPQPDGSVVLTTARIIKPNGIIHG